MHTRVVVVAALMVGLGVAEGCRKQPTVPSKSKEGSAEKTKQKKQEQEAESEEPVPEGPTGLVTVTSARAAPKVVKDLKSKIKSNDSLTLSVPLDHAKNAESVDKSLPPTTLLVFADPPHSTPVIEKSPLAALDFPLKLLVWKGGEGTKVAFNAPAYVAARHAVERASLFLNPMKETLVGMVEEATDASVDVVHDKDDVDVNAFEGVIKEDSQNGVGDTFDKLKSLIEDHDKLSVIDTVDFSANADDIDRSLRLSKMILFGNPDAGTPLMASSRTIGIDLPQKLLVYETKKGGIFVAYNNPFYLAERHDLEEADERLKKIKELLEEIVAKGTEEITP